MRRIGAEERRARLGRRHHLAAEARAADGVEVAGDLVGLHGTDPASVFLAAAARSPAAGVAALERALYDDRSLVRMVGMRRTVFVVPLDLVPVVHAACGRALAVQERRRLVQLLEQAGIAKDARTWLQKAERDTMRALRERGEATANELAASVPQLRVQLHFGEGKKWEGSQGVSTRLLFLLAVEGQVVRGRPRGSWASSQYNWAPVESWLGAPIDGLTTEAARGELTRRWLRAYGPGTVTDVKWWTGWTTGEARKALAAAAAVEVETDAGPAFVAPDEADAVAPPDPWAALLPGLDPTVMGWSERSFYLGPHGPALFDRSGNAGPTVWWDGRIVGGWCQRADGDVAYRLLEDVGADADAAIAAAAARLRDDLGPVRVTPRWRTPLERELAM